MLLVVYLFKELLNTTFVAIKNIVVGEEISINKDHPVPGGIFENGFTLHDGSVFYTHTYQIRTPKAFLRICKIQNIEKCIFSRL